MVRDSEAHCRGLQRRASFRGGATTVSMSLRPHGKVEMMEKYQLLTMMDALVMVKARERCGGLATCERCSRMDNDASAHHRREPWPK